MLLGERNRTRGLVRTSIVECRGWGELELN